MTIGITSCSTGRYVNNSRNVNLSQTQVVLSQANFQVVKQVSVTYVYTNKNTIRFDANQMKESAYAALVKKAKLTGAQVLINVTMEEIQRVSNNFWSALFFAPQYEQAILVSGTVIEFLPEGVTPTYSDTIESSIVYDSLSKSDYDSPSANTMKTEVIHNTSEQNYDSSIANTDKYEEVKRYYAKSAPTFFEIYEQVRQHMLFNKQTEVLDKVDNFLLTGNQAAIWAFRYEVLKSEDIDKDINKQIDIFIKYANMQ
ncbi:MAG TPA: hypothetical protein DIW30_03090 [Bacteroidales bacterium]|nr:hypothetical protein [Bacteroidales bacterium]